MSTAYTLKVSLTPEQVATMLTDAELEAIDVTQAIEALKAALPLDKSGSRVPSGFLAPLALRRAIANAQLCKVAGRLAAAQADVLALAKAIQTYFEHQGIRDCRTCELDMRDAVDRLGVVELLEGETP